MLARPDDAETDRGPRHTAAGAARLCIVTRAVTPTDDMIRFVVGPDRALVPDLKRKLPGRGVWVTARRDLLAEATRRGAFARALKAEVTVAADLPAVVDRLLEQSLLDAGPLERQGPLGGGDRQLLGVLGFSHSDPDSDPGPGAAFAPGDTGGC